MPNIKSAKKRVKVIKKKTLINKIVRTNLKTVLKKAEDSIKSNSETKLQDVTYAIKRIDQACAKGILHKNCASRKKSKLALKLKTS